MAPIGVLLGEVPAARHGMMSEREVRAQRVFEEACARNCKRRGWREAWSLCIAASDALSEVLGEPRDAQTRVPYDFQATKTENAASLWRGATDVPDRQVVAILTAILRAQHPAMDADEAVLAAIAQARFGLSDAELAAALVAVLPWAPPSEILTDVNFAMDLRDVMGAAV
jgi:hypothetical protein